MNAQTSKHTVTLVTLGRGRNEVDSDELAARRDDAGWRLAEDTEGADVAVVNTCGLIDSARKQSADALPQVSAVLSFDDYPDIGTRLDDVLAGRAHPAHRPADRRMLLPTTPVRRAESTVEMSGHGPASGPRPLRHRLGGGPVAPLGLASGCDLEAVVR